MAYTFTRHLSIGQTSLRCSVFAIAVSLLLVGAAYALQANLKQREEFSFLSEVLDRVGPIVPIVDWGEIPNLQAREFSALDQAEVAKDLTQAWASLIVASRSGNPEFLKDHFYETAYRRTKDQVTQTLSGVETAMVVLDMKTAPRFFHEDGSVLELKSNNTLVARYRLHKEENSAEALDVSRECTRQVLFLQTVGWKIRNHEIDCSSTVDLKKPAVSPREIKLPLIGLNYYPAETPWLEFWSNFQHEVVEADLQRMQEIGINSVRIFLPFGFFSDGRTQRTALEHLDWFLGRSSHYGLNVMPTLFDFKGAYISTNWPSEYQYMKAVVPILRKHNNVQIVDLKNEPDLDYELNSRPQVDIWLALFSGLLREIAPELSVTIGWLSHQEAQRMAEIVDVVSYHDYEDPTASGERYRRIKSAVGDKPVLITETGKPSWGLALDYPFSDEKQKDWLTDYLAALGSADGVMIWALHDFAYEDTASIADLPWRRAMQATYGLIDREGQDKPALEVLKAYAAWRDAHRRNHQDTPLSKEEKEK